MQAIRVHGPGDPDVLRLEDQPDPIPGEDQVLVRLKAAGVNPVDTYIRAARQGYTGTEYPYTPGTDGAGIVEAIGDEISAFDVGDRVYVTGSATGTYATLTLCAENQVHILPDELTFEQGAALGVPYATAYVALFERARVQRGDTILVHGASGGVGLATVQLAVAHGCQVIGTAGTVAGRELVASFGASEVFDHHSDGYLERAKSGTEDDGFDVIIEMLAHQNLAADLDVLAYGGRVVVVGSKGEIAITPRKLMRRDAAILGMSLRNASAMELQRVHEDLATGLRQGVVQPYIGRRLPLAEAAEAHRAVIEEPALGKTVLLLD